MAAAVARMAACRGKIHFLLRNIVRTFASQTEGEIRVAQVLKEKFPQAAAIKVVDISGGCGAMYEIHIESEEFKEKRMVQQHQMVNQVSRLTYSGLSISVWEIILHFQFHGCFGS
ncbi:Hypothetical predicted protein [Podarcis lilfordi]|uniref:BolA family member 3 n=1 Tax=Podarcis lilfordi TaxID=74358 RepID=A0AA35PG27_9SAUR|nr:Hypothetical predicted protein [Podarcis lilfordi]